MTKKKKPSRRPRSRTTYECALDQATRRLENAVEERTAALMKLDELAREIPNLESAVAGLKLLVEAKRIPPNLPHQDPYAPQQFTPPPAPQPLSEPSQEDYLARFMPRTGRVTTTTPQPSRRPEPDGTNPDPDEFLEDGGPGQEILS